MERRSGGEMKIGDGFALNLTEKKKKQRGQSDEISVDNAWVAGKQWLKKEKRKEIRRLEDE